MDIAFKSLLFTIEKNCVFLRKMGLFTCKNNNGFVEVHIAGEHKKVRAGAKMIASSEGYRLKYVSHCQAENCLEIVQKSDLVEVKTTFFSFEDTNAIRVFTEVKNISPQEIVLEEVSAFVFTGLGQNDLDSAQDLYFTRFLQSHHTECQPRRFSFDDLGLFSSSSNGQKRIAFANVGSWSTKEALPQGIVEDTSNNTFLMFQIESNSSWYYEISDNKGEYYLYLGSANLPFTGWSKKLAPNQSYRSCCVAVSFGNSLNSVIGEMTKYRRHISGKCVADNHLPSIFNEYMHLSWDAPSEENTKKIATTVAQTGVEYYVIDCGWHNEEVGDLYPFTGEWIESSVRFPNGIKAITNYLNSLGMKAGLWIEPEVIGRNCKNMLDYYDDDCFLQRNGKKILVGDRFFLDFRAKKVVDYLTEVIRRMVEDYGAQYIKLDYNQDCGIGTDYLSLCAGEGLELCAQAYLNWIDNIRARFPNTVFETCSSGGMHMDYKTLSHFSIISTSDQVHCLNYPYIAGNILSSVLPEQAAVWSYPVDILHEELSPVKDELVALNMINGFLGRIHLASNLEMLTKTQLELVKEGIAYYHKISEVKKKALPYFPKGLCRWGDESVVAGFETANKIYLAVWGLKTKNVCFQINNSSNIKIAYPINSTAKINKIENEIQVAFEKPQSAVFLEIEKSK